MGRVPLYDSLVPRIFSMDTSQTASKLQDFRLPLLRLKFESPDRATMNHVVACYDSYLRRTVLRGRHPRHKEEDREELRQSCATHPFHGRLAN